MDDAPAPDISPEQARLAFHHHLMEKAAMAREAYGPNIDADAIINMLADSKMVRYKTCIEFEAALLQPHEFAFAKPLGFHPADGYCLFMHPAFKDRRDAWPILVAYHIPVINYGEIVDDEAAETYAAALLQMSPEAYYDALCALVEGVVSESKTDAAGQ